MFKRDLEQELLKEAGQYPIVTVMGPRQSGKTTLCRSCFPLKPYVNLEAPDVRLLAQEDPRAFLRNYPDGALLDEIQRVPELLSYIQVIVDERGENGLYVLTGSHQMELHSAIAQSLAGRTALFTLLPMSLLELRQGDKSLSIDQALLKGGYPRIHKEGLDPYRAYRGYFQTYVEKDLRQLIMVKDLAQFHKCVQLCAGRIGQVLNMQGLANEVGVSSHTIHHWLSILEASYIIVRLQPYYENFGKRAIKSPKLYFVDVGLAAYLLGIENEKQMRRDPLRGHLVENLALSELMKSRYNRGRDPQLYYFRDVQGHEVDILFQRGTELIPIEIKAAETFHSSLLKQLHFFQALIPERVPRAYLLYGGELAQEINGCHLLPIARAAEVLE